MNNILDTKKNMLVNLLSPHINLPWRHAFNCRSDSYQLPVSSQDLKTCTAWRQKKKGVINKRWKVKRQPRERFKSECIQKWQTTSRRRGGKKWSRNTNKKNEKQTDSTQQHQENQSEKNKTINTNILLLYIHHLSLMNWANISNRAFQKRSSLSF